MRYKKFYLAEKGKKLMLQDKVKVLEEAITGLEKDCGDYEKIINKLEVEMTSLEHGLKPWVK